jgi:hypothetical protein
VELTIQERGGKIKKYKVWVQLETEYDDIEAENEEEAFVKASEYAMNGASWRYEVTEIEEVEE